MLGSEGRNKGKRTEERAGRKDQGGKRRRKEQGGKRRRRKEEGGKTVKTNITEKEKAFGTN